MPNRNTITVSVTREMARALANWADAGPHFVARTDLPTAIIAEVERLFRHDNEWLALLGSKMAKRARAKRDVGNMEIPKGMVIALSRAGDSGLLSADLDRLATEWFKKAHASRGRRAHGRTQLARRSAETFAIDDRHKRRLRKRLREAEEAKLRAVEFLETEGIVWPPR